MHRLATSQEIKIHRRVLLRLQRDELGFLIPLNWHGRTLVVESLDKPIRVTKNGVWVGGAVCFEMQMARWRRGREPSQSRASCCIALTNE